MWRIGCLFGVMVLVVAGLVAFVAWLVGSALGTSGGSGAAVAVLAVLLLLLLVAVGRGLRRAAVPLGELIEAAGQVEAGDYSARVTERGPSEVRALAHAFNAMSARLGASEAQRTELLAELGHELRTPLTVIQGNLEGMLDGVYPADAAHLAPVLEETRVLSRLIDDLRTLSLAEAGNLRLHPVPTDIGALLSDVGTGLGAKADAAGVALAVVAADQRPVLDVDPSRIREVVANLVANALRHTPPGGRVELRVEASLGGVAVEVSDTGVGIAPEVVERIFDRFYRTPDSPGSGLGLTIARKLVEAHGGTITATSELGRGTTVRFHLPALSAPQA